MASLRSFILTRIALFIPLLWFLLTLVFFLLRVLPGANPVQVLNPQMPAYQVELITEQLGLNKPLDEQYIDFLKQSIRFEFVNSYNTQAPVGDELKLVFGPTLMFAVFGTLIGFPLGIYLG